MKICKSYFTGFWGERGEKEEKYELKKEKDKC
jgi:hypothetical protein